MSSSSSTSSSSSLSSPSSLSNREKERRSSISRFDDVEFVRSDDSSELDKDAARLESYRKSIIKVDFVEPNEEQESESSEKQEQRNKKERTDDSVSSSEEEKDDLRDKRKQREETEKNLDRIIPGVERSIKRFGRPTVLYVDRETKDSFALWLKKDLRRKNYKHFDKVERTNRYEDKKNVLVTIHFRIPSEKTWDVLKIDRSLSYDRDAHLLTCRHESWSSCCALLYLACRSADDHISLEDIKKKSIVKKMLRNAQRSDKYVTKLKEIVSENNRKIK